MANLLAIVLVFLVFSVDGPRSPPMDSNYQLSWSIGHTYGLVRSRCGTQPYVVAVLCMLHSQALPTN